MTLRVVPEGLAAASARIGAITRTASIRAGRFGAADHRRDAARRRSGVVADRGRVQSSVAASMRRLPAQGAEELGRSGIGVAESGASYAVHDAAAAASYHGVWG